MKKVLSAILMLALVLAMAACGSSPSSAAPEGDSAGGAAAEPEASGSSSGKEDYVIEIILPNILMPENHNSLDDEIGRAIYDATGIIFDMVSYSGDYDEKCALMLAGGDYGEIQLLQYNVMVQKYIEAGVLLELSDLAAEHGPNVLDFYEDYIPLWRMADTEGGWYKIENAPTVQLATGPLYDVPVRSDILEQQGWPELLTEDDYVEVLKQGLADNPEVDGQSTVGMAFCGAESWGMSLLGYLTDKGKYSEAAGDEAVLWNHYTETFEDKVLNDYYKDSMIFFNRLYREGILDPECFTDYYSQLEEKCAAGRPLSVWYLGQDNANVTLRESGKGDMEYVFMPIVSQKQLDNGDERVIRLLDIYDWQSYAITDNAKDPERIMELFNWVCTPEAQVLMGWGIEGAHYTVNDEGLRVPTDACIESFLTDGDLTKWLARYSFLGLSYGFDDNGQCYNMREDESVNNARMTDRKKEVYAQYGWESVTDPWQENENFDSVMVHMSLAALCSPSGDSDMGKLNMKLTTYREDNVVPLIMAASEAEFEAKYAEFLDGYMALDPEPCIQAFNDKYAQLKAQLDSYAQAS